MKKIAIMGIAIGAFLLSACNDDTDKLTSDQQMQLQQQRMAQQEAREQRQHELDMARAANPAPVIQGDTQYVPVPVSTPRQEYYDDEPVSRGYVQSDRSHYNDTNVNSSGSSVGSHVATAAVGAATGYMAHKYLSSDKGKEQVGKAKTYMAPKVNTVKQKAYTGYRFTKYKASSKFRSFKKRK